MPRLPSARLRGTVKAGGGDSQPPLIPWPPLKTSVKPRPVRVAIIGTGGMANRHVELYRQIPGVEIVAGCDVDRARVLDFARGTASRPPALTPMPARCCGGRVRRSLECDPRLLSRRALYSGVKSRQTCALRKTSRARPRRDAPHGRCRQKSRHSGDGEFLLPGLVRASGHGREGGAGELGELRHVEASYLQTWLTAPLWGDWRTTPAWLWRLSTGHGSKGVLGDVGVHIVDFATFPAGPIKQVYCQLKTFPKAPRNRIGEYQLDANDSAIMNVEFANGALGTIHTTRWATGHPNRLALKLHGTLGALSFDSDLGTDVYRVCAGADAATATWREVRAEPTPNNHTRFISAIRTGRPEQPDFARGSEVQRVLDACFESSAAGRPVRI